MKAKRVRNAVISAVFSGVIIWFLLSKIDLREVPRTIAEVPLWSLAIAFLLYAASIFLKTVRFKVILRTDVSLRRLFPIISLYAFFTNILPMRTGELSYVYLLKKQMRTPGAKSFASLVVGGVADVIALFIGVFAVGWYLRGALAEGPSRFLAALGQKIEAFAQAARYNLLFIIIAAALLVGGVIGLALLIRNRISRQSRVVRLASIIKAKILEVGRELADTSLDSRLLGIIVSTILILAFRLSSQWFLVRGMGIDIGVWELSFALLCCLLFSLFPVHGLAGFGTIEALWVAILHILSVPEKDAITSGFGLHIIVVVFCIVLGLYGAVDLRLARSLHWRRDG